MSTLKLGSIEPSSNRRRSRTRSFLTACHLLPSSDAASPVPSGSQASSLETNTGNSRLHLEHSSIKSPRHKSSFGSFTFSHGTRSKASLLSEGSGEHGARPVSSLSMRCASGRGFTDASLDAYDDFDENVQSPLLAGTNEHGSMASETFRRLDTTPASSQLVQASRSPSLRSKASGSTLMASAPSSPAATSPVISRRTSQASMSSMASYATAASRLTSPPPRPPRRRPSQQSLTVATPSKTGCDATGSMAHAMCSTAPLRISPNRMLRALSPLPGGIAASLKASSGVELSTEGAEKATAHSSPAPAMTARSSSLGARAMGALRASPLHRRSQSAQMYEPPVKSSLRSELPWTLALGDDRFAAEQEDEAELHARTRATIAYFARQRGSKLEPVSKLHQPSTQLAAASAARAFMRGSNDGPASPKDSLSSFDNSSSSTAPSSTTFTDPSDSEEDAHGDETQKSPERSIPSPLSSAAGSSARGNSLTSRAFEGEPASWSPALLPRGEVDPWDDDEWSDVESTLHACEAREPFPDKAKRQTLDAINVSPLVLSKALPDSICADLVDQKSPRRSPTCTLSATPSSTRKTETWRINTDASPSPLFKADQQSEQQLFFPVPPPVSGGLSSSLRERGKERDSLLALAPVSEYHRRSLSSKRALARAAERAATRGDDGQSITDITSSETELKHFDSTDEEEDEIGEDLKLFKPKALRRASRLDVCEVHQEPRGDDNDLAKQEEPKFQPRHRDVAFELSIRPVLSNRCRSASMSPSSSSSFSSRRITWANVP
ncbi:hypothetical protein CBOM_02264 [Ceraceosorus bombacis]|uniref:Uncharacterized protein n=1 Tax=Ceraceosorus bombacis TaxID=401625 RepID=A0A0P1BE67_9BASI|nr:hypothetical protein CBOM_02264 [Ceraceosorus bombacis]